MPPVPPARPPRDVLEQDFRRELAHEILVSQRLRATILACVFAGMLALLGASDVYQALVFGVSVVPPETLMLVLGVALYELSMRRYIARRLAAGRTVPQWMWYANALVEVTVPTAGIWLMQSHVEHPLQAFVAPTQFVYYVFIVLSVLLLDFKLTVFTGAVAAAEYLALALTTIARYGGDAHVGPLLGEPVIYIGKAGLLLGVAAGAAFVAAQFRGRVTGALSAVHERNRIREADRMKSQFLASVSHEIRTPLNAVLGYAQLLEAEPGLAEPHRRAVRAIGNSGGHLLALINDVLDLSKIEAGREDLSPSSFDLGALAQDLAVMFRLRCEQKGIGWRMAIDPLPGRVIGDERKLRQILTNLLANAVTLTEQGHVTLNVVALADARYVFEVIDTGPGISPERQASIFEPFAQDGPGREKGGTGLGLAIAGRYASLMGGTLAVTSAPGAETRFSLSVALPAAEGRPDRPADDAWRTVIRLVPDARVRALVVDDVAENRAVLAAMLERIGVDVDVASDAPGALAAVDRLHPDIVFLDIRMPGLSGTETRDRIAALPRRDRVKCVAVSASALSHHRDDCLRAGFDDFLDKPVRMSAVYETLARLLGVRFVFAPEDASEGEPSGAIDLASVTVADDVFQDLEAALRSHDMSETKRLLDRLETLGSRERLLADRLRELGRRYDMPAMLATLRDVRHG